MLSKTGSAQKNLQKISFVKDPFCAEKTANNHAVEGLFRAEKPANNPAVKDPFRSEKPANNPAVEGLICNEQAPIRQRNIRAADPARSGGGENDKGANICKSCYTCGVWV